MYAMPVKSRKSDIGVVSFLFVNIGPKVDKKTSTLNFKRKGLYKSGQLSKGSSGWDCSENEPCLLLGLSQGGCAPTCKRN